MFIAVFFIIGKTTQSLSKDGWINKMWYISTMDYYSSIKRNDVLIHTTTWMSLADTTLREVSQTQKDKFYMIPLI